MHRNFPFPKSMKTIKYLDTKRQGDHTGRTAKPFGEHLIIPFGTFDTIISPKKENIFRTFPFHFLLFRI